VLWRTCDGFLRFAVFNADETVGRGDHEGGSAIGGEDAVGDRAVERI